MIPHTPEAANASRELILITLEAGRMTATDLVPIVGKNIKTVQDYMRDLAAAGKIHVAARIGHNLNTKLYALGPGPDASNMAGRVMDALRQRPMTTKELCALLGESSFSVRKTCDRLRQASPRRVYVVDWTREQSERNRAEHVFALGDLPDKPKPRPYSTGENAARARKRLRAQLKADPVRYVEWLMSKRRSYARTKKHVPTDPFLSQFAGIFGRQAA